MLPQVCCKPINGRSVRFWTEQVWRETGQLDAKRVAGNNISYYDHLYGIGAVPGAVLLCPQQTDTSDHWQLSGQWAQLATESASLQFDFKRAKRDSGGANMILVSQTDNCGCVCVLECTGLNTENTGFIIMMMMMIILKKNFLFFFLSHFKV